MAENRHLGRARKTATALAVALVAFGATVVPTTPVGAACDLVPVVRDTMVNQGVQSYPTLARGKETLVKFFLNKPSCATSEDDIQLVGGTLKVTGLVAGQLLPIFESEVPVTTPELGEVYPSISPFGTVSHSSAGDPLFVVDGDVLSPALWSDEFNVRFSGTIQYRSKPAGAADYGPVQSAGPFSTSGVVGAVQNKLRLLIVPMGDASQTPWTEKQFPTSAEAVVQRSMVTLSRVLPVADGAALFADTSAEASKAGIRYGFAPTVVDLGPNGLNLMSSTKKFCGTADNWPKVATKLTAALQAFNTREENQATPADRVLGVVWEGVSEGAGTRNNCAEGWANVNAKEGWFRSITSTTPSPSGAIATMELAHTLGQVSSSDKDRFATGYHSKNVEADVSEPNRGYNVSLREWLLDDRSALNFSPPGWDEYSVLLEMQDWAFVQCRITEGATEGAPCADPGDVGSSGASASDAIVLTGTITDTETDLHTYFEQTTLLDEPVDSGEYTLVQRTAASGSGALAGPTYGIPASNEVSAHDHDDVADHEHTTSVDAALPVHDGAVRFEVWRSDPTTDASAVLLYARNLDDSPEIETATAVPSGVSETNLTATSSVTDTEPALSPDGTRVAYATGGAVVVRNTDGTGEPVAVASGASPAWNSAGDRLAFVRNGSVYTVAANGENERVVYDKTIQADLLFPDAAHPSWNGDDSEIAAAIQGDLWALATNPQTPITCVPGVKLGDCRQLTQTSDVKETHPSWRSSTDAGPAAHDVAYRADGAGITGGVWTLDSGGSTAPELRIAGGDMPEWGGPHLFFVKDGSVQVVVADTFAGAQSLTSGSSPAPASDGQTFGFERDGDVWLAKASKWTITVIASDNNASELRADFFLECSSAYPIAVDEEGEEQPDGTRRFTIEFDPSLGCEGDGTLSVRITDGWTTVTEEFGTIKQNRPPVGAIYGPGTVLQYDAIPLKANTQDDSGVQSTTFLLSGPGINGEAVVGTGEAPPDAQPPLPGGWTPGVYTLILEIVDVDGEVTRVTTEFEILADSDHDNQSDPKEQLPCYPEGAELDGTNGSDNYDGDLWLNVDDPDPCTSAYNATIDFDPNTLELNASSGPDVVTIYLSTSAGSLSDVDPTTVRIIKVGGYDVSLANSRWYFDSSRGWTAQFDRKALIGLIPPELAGSYVPIVVRGDADGFTFLGSDPASPVTSS